MELKDLERRLENLESIEAIKQLQETYVNCLTVCDWDGMAECFTENATLEFAKGKNTGRPNLLRQFREGISQKHVGLEGIFIVHPKISVDGDKGKGNWLMYVMSAHNRPAFRYPPPDWIQGYYDAEYEKEDGKWKISYLRYRERLCSARVSVY